MCRKSFYAVLPMLMITGLGIFSVLAYASTINTLNATDPGTTHESPRDSVDVESLAAFPNAHMITLPAAETPGNPSGPPEHVPPINPPIDTPAFNHGLANTPTTMPASVPAHTLPGSGFGRTVVPVPAAVWLFGTGLLGLLGIARRNKAS